MMRSRRLEIRPSRSLPQLVLLLRLEVRRRQCPGQLSREGSLRPPATLSSHAGGGSRSALLLRQRRTFLHFYHWPLRRTLPARNCLLVVVRTSDPSSR